MSLTLYFHPLSSFCHKVLIALYENGTPFTPHMVDLATRLPARGVQKHVADRKISGAARRSQRPAGAQIEHHHRVSGPELSGQAPNSCRPIRSWHGRRRSATASTICTSTRRCRRSSATGGARRNEGSARRVRKQKSRSVPRLTLSSGGWAATPGRWAMGSRMADCAAAPALFYADKVVLFEAGAPERGPLSQAADGAAVLRPRAAGSRALFPHVS